MPRIALRAIVGVVLAAALVPGAIPGMGPGDGTAPADRVSPSFTWGEVPAAKGPGLAGTWHRFALIQEADLRTYRVTTRAQHVYWTFFPDGRCYYSMPAEGLDNFSYDYVRSMNELWCCSYRLEGDGGVIAWGTGGTTVPFVRKGAGMLIGKTRDAFEPLDPCDGVKMRATYKRHDWQAEYSPKAGIAFSADGVFADEGFLGGAISTWWWKDRGMVDASFAPGRGTYRVAKNSLVLLYDDGRKYRANFHLEDGSSREKVEAFWINGWKYVRVD